MTSAPDIDWQDVPARPPDPTTDAERAVLGAAITAPALVPDLAAIIRDDDWATPAHTLIWHAITDRAATGAPIDLLTLTEAIGPDPALRGHGGPLYLHRLVESVATVSNATWHARIVAEHAQRRRTGALGTWLTQAAGNGVTDDQIRDRIEAHLADRNPADPQAASSWAALDLEPALAGDDAADRPTLMPRSDGQPLLYPGVNVISGEPTAGKSWLALHAVKDQLDQAQPVTYLDFEDRASRVVRRLLDLGTKPDHVREHLRYVRPHLALDTPARRDLERVITGASLAVLDGVTEAMTLHGLDLSSNPDVATFYALLPRWIADRGPVVLLIDHVVKDSERQGRWQIGGQHKLAGLDGASYTVRTVEPFGRGRRGHSRVFIAKDRHGHVEEHALGRTAAEFTLDATDPDTLRATLDPPEAMPTTEGGEPRPTVLMEKVSRWLEINPGQTVNGVKQAKLGKVAYVNRALTVLVTEGYISTEPGPRNALLHHVVTPYRRGTEADEPWPDDPPDDPWE